MVVSVSKNQIIPQRPIDGLQDYAIISDGVSGTADALNYLPDPAYDTVIHYPFPVLIDLKTEYTLSGIDYSAGPGTRIMQLFGGPTPYSLTQIGSNITLITGGTFQSVPSTLANVRFVKVVILSAGQRFPSEIRINGTQTGANYVAPSISPIVYPITWEARGVNGNPGGNDPAKMGDSYRNVRFFINKGYFHQLVGGVKKARYDTSYQGGVTNAKLQAFRTNGMKILACLQFSQPYILNQDATTHNDNYKPIAYNADPLVPASYTDIAQSDFWDVAMYGSGVNPVSDIPLDFTVFNTNQTQPSVANLGLVDYWEVWNEPSKTWQQRYGYYTPDEYSTMLSARSDGHEGRLGAKIGIKAADANAKVVMTGLVTIDLPYIQGVELWCKYNRTDTKIPAVAINIHQYFQNSDKTAGISPEDYGFYDKISAIVAYKNQFLKYLEVWVTETGYDTNSSIYAPPAAIGSWNREDLQGIWGIRTSLEADRAGVDKQFDYTFADEYGVIDSSSSPYGKAGDVTSEATGQNYKRGWYYKSEFHKLHKGTNFKFRDAVLSPFRKHTYVNSVGDLMIFCYSPTSNNTVLTSQNIALPSGAWSSAKRYVLNGTGAKVQTIISNTADFTDSINEVPTVYHYIANNTAVFVKGVIPLSSDANVAIAKPWDARTKAVPTFSWLSAILYPYVSLRVKVLDESSWYEYNGTVWTKDTGTSGSTLTEITDSTRRTLLSTSSNWDAGNNYIGTAITGSVGDYYIDANYLYQLFNKTGSTTVLTVERKTISGVITDFTYTITCDGTTELFSITNLLNNQNFEATLWYTDSSDTTIPSGGRRLQTVYGLDATDATININISGFNPATRVYTLYTIGRWKAPVASTPSTTSSSYFTNDYSTSDYTA